MIKTYTISEFAALSGVTTRTLRYYHERGLLRPQVDANGYRRFASADIDRLRLIQFYHQVGFSLAETTDLMTLPREEQRARLAAQRDQLIRSRDTLATRIATIDTLLTEQETPTMTDTMKFAALKQDILRQNDAKYGAEVTETYGAKAKAENDRHFAGLSQADYDRSLALESDLIAAIKAALAADTVSDELSNQIFTYHRDWLKLMSPHYSAAYHLGLANLYESDERFADYYNTRAGHPDASAVLVAAIRASLA